MPAGAVSNLMKLAQRSENKVRVVGDGGPSHYQREAAEAHLPTPVLASESREILRGACLGLPVAIGQPNRAWLKSMSYASDRANMRKRLRIQNGKSGRKLPILGELGWPRSCIDNYKSLQPEADGACRNTLAPASDAPGNPGRQSEEC